MGRFLLALTQMIVGMAVLTGLGAAAALAVVLWQFDVDLDEYALLTQHESAVLSRLYDRRGEPLAELARERRIFVPRTSMPPLVVEAFLSAEDKNFYQHFGLDMASLVRASVYNLRNLSRGTGARLHGGSTITQQVAKHFAPDEPRSLERKLKEAVIALHLERRYSKDEILEFYLNEIYLGQGSYGVAAAARDYFDKDLADLTLSEAAFLAALPKAPNNYHPVHNYRAALMRRNWVVSRMMKNGYITRERALKAQEESLRVRADKAAAAPAHRYFVDYVRRQLQERYGEALYAGGLHIHTSLDVRLQRLAHKSLLAGLSAYDRRHGWRGPVARLGAARDRVQQMQALTETSEFGFWRHALVEEVSEQGVRLLLVRADGRRDEGWLKAEDLAWVRRAGTPLAEQFRLGDVVWVERQGEGWALRQIPEVNGALVVLEAGSGEILAMSGGSSFTQSQFNRATQAWRQPGSAFKPFIYAAALESGYTPASQFLDAPFVARRSDGQGFWKPENYDRGFLGIASLRLGLENSRNLMTIRLATALGLPLVADYAARFGLNDALLPVPAIALGSGETTLLRLANAYGTFAAGGRKQSPVAVTRVQNREGQTLWHAAPYACADCAAASWAAERPPELSRLAPEQIVSPQTAYQMISMLKGVVARGTAHALNDLDLALAAKTGTSNDTRDVWFIGVTPDLVVGCFVGFDQPRSLGDKVSGANTALPIVRDFLLEAVAQGTGRDFAVPPDLEYARVDLKTGEPSASQRNSVLEVFKSGNAPPPPPPLSSSQAARRTPTDGLAPNFAGVY